jgi:hypothetical protein
MELAKVTEHVGTVLELKRIARAYVVELNVLQVASLHS